MGLEPTRVGNSATVRMTDGSSQDCSVSSRMTVGRLNLLSEDDVITQLTSVEYLYFI
jgi:translation initiation factor IF-1